MNAALAGSPVIRVLCVDDLPDMTAALRLIIGTDPSMVCIGCLSSANELVRKVQQGNLRPDVLILDATMPGRDPFTAMRELADRCPGTRTIIYSGYDDADFIDRAIEAGAWRCISKHDEPLAILRAIREVATAPVGGVRPS